ncbi:unnamed protein product [Rotaria socialis]
MLETPTLLPLSTNKMIGQPNEIEILLLAVLLVVGISSAVKIVPLLKSINNDSTNCTSDAYRINKHGAHVVGFVALYSMLIFLFVSFHLGLMINHLPVLNQSLNLNMKPSKEVLRWWLDAFLHLGIFILLSRILQLFSTVDYPVMIINGIYLCFTWIVAFRLTVTIEIVNFVEEIQLDPRPTASPSLCHSIPE